MPHLRRPRLLLPALLATAALGAACATTDPPRRALQYTDEARTRYERAMVLFQEEAWPEATESFRELRREFGLSRWAWLAELRLADIEFKQERFAQALQGYRNWLRYHPTQPEVAYAHFMICRCYYSQIPEDWFLVPASWERDQSSVHDAESALARFVHDYPDAEERPEAQRLLRQTRSLLAHHEIYVAGFYASRERFPAAISRLLEVIESYQGSGLEAQALLQLGEIYLRTGRHPEARGAFLQVVEEHPASNQVVAARRYLALVGRGDVVAVGANTRPSTPPEPSGASTPGGT